MGHTLGLDLRHTGFLLGQYVRRDTAAAIVLMASLLGASFLSTYLALRSQVYLADLVNALVAKNAAPVRELIGLLLSLTLGSLLVGLAGVWAGLVIRMRFRNHLSPQLVGRWMEADRFFQQERQAPLDYPEQRIQEDVFLFAERFITPGPGIIGALYSMALYSGQLWKMSPPLTLALPGNEVAVPGFLVYFAIAFGLISTVVMHLAGRCLTRVEVVRQHLEAQFRAEMANIRSNAEAIALFALKKSPQIVPQYAGKRSWFKTTGPLSGN